MPYQRDFVKYHQSIAQELDVTKNRVRDLIGNSHWLSDGEFKEAVLRKILINHVPESMRVGKGFICYPSEEQDNYRNNSSQLDILITSKNKYTLFKDGELTIVTPDVVEAIIEVKTKHNKSELEDDLKKLAEQAKLVRKYSPNCWIGLFIYEGDNSHENVLKAVNEAVNVEKEKVINSVSIGMNTFILYWENGREIYSKVNGPVWHSYKFEEKLKDLAPAYFISNIVWHLTPNPSEKTQEAWFPIEESNGKETFRKFCIGIEKNAGLLAF